MNELHDYIEKHPHAIPPPNVSDSMCVKVNVNLLKPEALSSNLSMSVSRWYDFTSFSRCFFGARNEDGRLFIGDKSLRVYIPKHISPMSNRDKITCGCETYISAMLLQSDFDKWQLKQWNFL